MKLNNIEILTAGPSMHLVSNQANENMFYGFPYGGAMDEKSYKVVNEILQKPAESRMLECSLKACRLLFKEDLQICIAGADMNWKMDEVPINRYEKISIKAGQTLSGGYAHEGLYSYIGFSHNVEKIDDKLIQLSSKKSKKIKSKKEDYQFKINDQLKIRRGPEWDLLTQESKEALMFFEAFITKDLSRMGVYLESKALSLKGDFPSKSVCTFPGVIQLLPNGQLLVLNKDAQTTGGYPRIAYFDNDNLCDLNQLPMGHKIKWRLLL